MLLTFCQEFQGEPYSEVKFVNRWLEQYDPIVRVVVVNILVSTESYFESLPCFIELVPLAVIEIFVSPDLLNV